MKGRALRTGAVLRVVSPASAAKEEAVAAGVRQLQEMGYTVQMGEHALARGPLYYAGTVQDRLADLHAAFADKAVDAVICTRGGWGSAELLPLLDRDLIRANPKPFIGFSDQTSLQQWMWRECGLVTFYGPMVSADWSKYASGRQGADLASWHSALHWESAWSVCGEQGLRMLRPGRAEGVLRGGCLSILTEGLGTPYGMRAEGGVLFLEDVSVAPYQWDRMLCHLRLAGQLAGVTGIVLGHMEQSAPENEQALLVQAILHALADFAGPIAIGLRSGHVHAGNVTLPLGVRVRLDCEENPRLYFLEAATEL